MITFRSVPLLLAVFAPSLASAQQKKERDVISRQELVDAAPKFPDLFAAVRSLRPHFLNVNRGMRTTGLSCTRPMDEGCGQRTNTNSIGEQTVPVPVVYIDGKKSGQPELLKGITTSEVEEVRYLTANQAEMEFGLGHDGGAILVK